jgi:hypothetical protein
MACGIEHKHWLSGGTILVMGCAQNAYFSAFISVQFIYMAPVAGGIADTKEDRLVFSLGFLKSLITPGIPIYRVMGMLQKVGGFLVNQPVGEFRFGHWESSLFY